MSRLNCIVALVLPVLLSACIDLPEVADPEPPDGGLGNPEPGFTLAVTPSRIAIPQAGNHVFQVSITRKHGFTGDVSVALLNPPSDITAPSATLPSGDTTANLAISIGESTEPGTQSLVLRGTAGSLAAEASIELTVLQLDDLIVRWGDPVLDKVYVNGTLPLMVSIEGGTADSLEFLKGSDVLARIERPPYQFDWDPAQEAEGNYQITARAKRGGFTFESTLLTVVIDRTPPTLTSRTPQPGASSVSVQETFQAIFSEPLKPSSVTNSSVVVSAEGTNSIEKTLALTPDGTRLTVTPTGPLPIQSTVTISLGNSTERLTDLAGNPLTPTGTWTFSVPAWLPLGGPISAVPGNTGAENVSMKIGLDGKPVIAWTEADGSSRNIYVQRWNGTDWEPLGGALSALSGANTPADHPSLVLDSSSTPVVTWDESTGTDFQSNTNLYSRKWTGSHWEELPAFTHVLAPGDKRARPATAIDTSGDLYAFADYFNGAFLQLQGFRLNKATSAWDPLNPSTPGHQGNPFGVSIATYGAGKLIVAYQAFLDAANTVGIAAMQESWAQFGNGLLITSSSNRSAGKPSVAVDGAGAPIVAWHEASTVDDISEGIIYAARWNNSWKLIGTIVSPDSTSNIEPSLVLGPDGNPFIAWSGYTQPERTILVSRWTGSTWQAVGAPLSGASDISTASFKPALATDSRGQLLVAWQESDGSASNIYVYRFNN